MTQAAIDLSGDSGILKEILQEGTGEDKPIEGCKVSVHYTGRLTDGTVFDSSVNKGEPFEFFLGRRQVIKAFDAGIASMRLGEKCKLTCAPKYAYGDEGSPPSIPPGATLIFDLELLGWKGEDLSPNSDGSIQRFVIEKSIRSQTVSEGAMVQVHLIGKYDGVVFEDREVKFDYGEGGDCGIVEGVEIALEKIPVGETSKLIIKPKYAFGEKGNEAFKIPSYATVEYIVKLISCEKGIEEWKLNDEERGEQVKLYKEKGTRYFKKDNYTLAIKMYKKCIEILPANATDELTAIKVAAQSNIGLCYQKTNEHLDAITWYNYALATEPNNIKALFRRGQCRLTTNDYAGALKDFHKVIELEPTNKAAANQITMCGKKVKESAQKEKQIYANMFTKFATADKQKEDSQYENGHDVLDECGEWTEKDAQREADLAFERDNNIVMI